MSWVVQFAVSLCIGLAEKLTPTVLGWFREQAAAKQLEADRKAIREAVAKAKEGVQDAPH